MSTATEPIVTSPRLRPKRAVPEGLWLGCPGCNQTIYRMTVEDQLGTCPECNHHFYVSAPQRIAQLLDEGTFEEWDSHLEPTDPLGFVDKRPYAQKLKAEQSRTGMKDAIMVPCAVAGDVTAEC